MPNGLRQLLPVDLVNAATALPAIRQETAFHENRRAAGTTNDPEATMFHPPIYPPRLVNDVRLHEMRQEFALRGVIESLNPSRSPIRSRVEMDADEDGVPVSIGYSNPTVQGNEAGFSGIRRLDTASI